MSEVFIAAKIFMEISHAHRIVFDKLHKVRRSVEVIEDSNLTNLCCVYYPYRRGGTGVFRRRETET